MAKQERSRWQRRGDWWYAFGLRVHLTMNLNDWALPLGVDWGAEYFYPRTDDSKLLEYRWFGISVGPFELTAFKDYDLWDQSKAKQEQDRWNAEQERRNDDG